ncbi:MAG TPA: hypothetical protein VEZ88_09450 [Steroidobacteraceae bacterium]|nr:hypothetical protein [Steroidobacteraceae bacterium]
MRFATGTRVFALAGLLCTTPAWTATTTEKAARAKEAFAAMRTQVKSGADRKLGSQLAVIQGQTSAGTQPKSLVAAPLGGKMRGLLARDGYVSVSAYPEAGMDLAALKAALISKGMLDASQHENAVSGRVPLGALADIANTQGLHFLRPAMAMTRAGLVTSQGDRSMRTDTARQRFGINGRNVRVGVMSDSYDCAPGAFAEGAPFTRAADDIASDDLPKDVIVLKDLSATPSNDCADEGRAIMQLIHDVAPGASLAFYTAFESAEDFAAGIGALVKAGSNIIVDDVIYFAEPMFLDGPIALAAEKAASKGVAFFSSAGNDARQAYQSRFRNSGFAGVSGGPLHDFDAGKGVDPLQSVTAQAGSVTLLSFQWDQPFFSVTGGAGSASDVDAYFLDAEGVPIEICTDDPNQVVCQIPGLDFNVGADAIEIPILVNLSDTDLQAQLAVELFEGPAPKLMRYVYFDLDAGAFLVNEFDTKSGTAYGHTNAAHVEAVGAAPFYNTEEFGQNKPECGPACLENFSSAGGVPILFDKKGGRLPIPDVRLKPGVTGPDGGNTTFFFFDLDVAIPGTTEPDGFPNFFGTSASAPHVAAIGALMLDKRQRDIAAHKHFLGPKDLSPDVMYWALRVTAQDVRARAGITSGPFPIDHGRGFDFDSGFGFVDAVRAIQLISGF